MTKILYFFILTIPSCLILTGCAGFMITRVKVIDVENNKPVPNTLVSYTHHYASTNSLRPHLYKFPMEGAKTDRNGVAWRIKWQSTPATSVRVELAEFLVPNHYITDEDTATSLNFPILKFPPVRFLTLNAYPKRNKAPHSSGVIMPATRHQSHDFLGERRAPKEPKSWKFAYDCVVADWCSPHGKGLTNDILFVYTYTPMRHKNYIPKDMFDQAYRKTRTISFPNFGDGLQPYQFKYINNRANDLIAPTNGYEQLFYSHFVRVNGRNSAHNSGSHMNFYYRVRTQYDDTGRIVSGFYGKLKGDFRFHPDSKFHSYLNTQALDRNLEF